MPGRPTYRDIAEKASYSRTALSQAAVGRELPTLAVTLAFVAACDGPVAEWEQRWRIAAADGKGASGPAEPTEGAATPCTVRRPIADRLRDRGAISALALTTAVACVIAVVLWQVNPTTGASLPGQARPRLQVESSGLYVRYAMVTNTGTRAGYAYIINAGADKVHRSPRPVRPGTSWTYFFNRELKDGAQICGSIDPGPAACTDVHP